MKFKKNTARLRKVFLLLFKIGVNQYLMMRTVFTVSLSAFNFRK